MIRLSGGDGDGGTRVIVANSRFPLTAIALSQMLAVSGLPVCAGV